jgi:hypothetical protein
MRELKIEGGDQSLARRLGVNNVDIFFLLPSSDQRTFLASYINTPLKLKAFNFQDEKAWPPSRDHVREYLKKNIFRLKFW